MPLFTYRCLNTGCRVQGFRRATDHHANPSYADADAYWLIYGVYEIPAWHDADRKERCCDFHQVAK
jgi:hypothetical protein